MTRDRGHGSSDRDEVRGPDRPMATASAERATVRASTTTSRASLPVGSAEHDALRFGLQDSGWGTEPRHLRTHVIDLATRAEAAGFDVLTSADHPLPSMRPPLSALLLAAEATTHLRVGTMVLNNDLWNPVLLAREAATLHLLSGGRFELGLGAGHAKADYDLVGVPYDPPGTRVTRLAESVEVIRRLLDGETLTFSGRHHRVVDATLGVPAANTPMPLLVGGNGGRVLTAGGRHADYVGLTGLVRNIDFGHAHQPDWSDAYLDDRIAIVRAEADAHGRRVGLNALVQRAEITDDREAAAVAFCREVAGAGITLRADAALTTPFLLFGTADEIAAQLLDARARFGFTYFTTRTDSFAAMTEVIACVRAREGAPTHPG